MKQTAVEWLINEMHKKEQGLIEASYNHLFDQAKEMEKKQKGYSEEDMHSLMDELPEIGAKEFNDLCSHFFGGKRKKERSYSEEEIPNELESVLAEIHHHNDLGLSKWYEVVYYADGKWCSYNSSKTFQDGERVVDWKYCKEVFETVKNK